MSGVWRTMPNGAKRYIENGIDVTSDYYDKTISKIFKNSDRELYSDKQNMKRNINNVINGKHDFKNHVILGEKTPPVLLENGFDDKPLTIAPGKLNAVIKASGKGDYNYHNLGINGAKDLTTSMNFPRYILRNKKLEGLIIVTKLKDYANRPIIISIVKNGNAQIGNKDTSANVITSAYGRNEFDDWIKKQDIIWQE